MNLKMTDAQKTLYYIAENMKLEKKISDEGYEHFQMAIKALEQQPNEDCVSRQAVIDMATTIQTDDYSGNEILEVIDVDDVKTLPPVTPIHGTCKDCKNWKDSDGAYRRGLWAESKCPVNNSSVFEGTFYCADFEKRGDLDGI